MFTQDVLHSELARRVRAAQAGLDGCLAPAPAGDASESLAELEAAAALAASSGVAAIAVLRHLDLAVFVRSSLEFALGLDGTRRDAWFRAFTPTVFVAGNPANLVARFPFDHVSADASVAWLGPVPPEQSMGLRRLLKLFDGSAELRPVSRLALDVPGAGGRRLRRIYVATAGVRLSDYLVHLNHTLAEAVLTGAIDPGDHLVLHHVPRLGAVPSPYQALRVHRDTRDPGRLRAYAGLCTE
jgi:hypothetical protein